jgi:hypothetical protein
MMGRSDQDVDGARWGTVGRTQCIGESVFSFFLLPLSRLTYLAAVATTTATTTMVETRHRGEHEEALDRPRTRTMTAMTTAPASSLSPDLVARS